MSQGDHPVVSLELLRLALVEALDEARARAREREGEDRARLRHVAEDVERALAKIDGLELLRGASR